MYAALRCGDVGIYGRGCHAHNDLLGFELCWRDVPLVVDPGSYVYTADPAERNAFRSTAAHATLQVDDREQNEFLLDRLFAMPDRAQAEVLSFAERPLPTFKGRHRGFSTPEEPCLHTRTATLDGPNGRLEVVDEVEGAHSHELTWHFPLAPCDVTPGPGVATARFSGVTLVITGDGLEVDIRPGYLSAAYGERTPAPVVIMRGRSHPGTHRSVVTLVLSAD